MATIQNAIDHHQTARYCGRANKCIAVSERLKHRTFHPILSPIFPVECPKRKPDSDIHITRNSTGIFRLKESSHE